MSKAPEKVYCLLPFSSPPFLPPFSLNIIIPLTESNSLLVSEYRTHSDPKSFPLCYSQPHHPKSGLTWWVLAIWVKDLESSPDFQCVGLGSWSNLPHSSWILTWQPSTLLSFLCPIICACTPTGIRDKMRPTSGMGPENGYLPSVSIWLSGTT